jgi:hypothetical protein
MSTHPPSKKLEKMGGIHGGDGMVPMSSLGILDTHARKGICSSPTPTPPKNNIVIHQGPDIF